MLKKTLFAVLVVTLAAFGAGTAMAQNMAFGVPGTQIDGMVANDGGALPVGLDTHVNPGGLGDALIYGYYNVREGLNLFNIVNTSNTTGIKVRVRFREGERSAEVLDFNVCLSAGDRWTALLAGSATGPAVIYPWDDDTVTAPVIPAGGQPFKYASTGNPAAHVTADLTQEGYIEIIGAVAIADDLNTSADDWTPAMCELAQATGFEVPNVLLGAIQIIPIDTLESYGYNATAIANCVQNNIDAALTTTNPNLDDCQDTVLGVEYALTKNNVYAAYDVTDFLAGATEVILTFPTMHFHAPYPAGDLFDDDGVTTTCWGPEMEMTLLIWDDEEHQPTSTTGFSPAPEAERDILCNEVNVIGLGGSTIMNSILRHTFSWPTADAVSNWDIGWIQLTLDNETNHMTTFGANTTYGLPTIGYRLDSLIDGFFPTMAPIHYDAVVGIQ